MSPVDDVDIPWRLQRVAGIAILQSLLFVQNVIENPINGFIPYAQIPECKGW